MSNEADDEQIKSYDSQDMRDDNVYSINSRLSSASRKTEEQRSAPIKNSFDNELSNETPRKSPNSSRQNSDQLNSHRLINENQLLIDSLHHQISDDELNTDDQDLTRNSFDHNTDHHNERQNPLTATVPEHSTCRFRADKKWVDLQFHQGQSDEFGVEIIKKPDELEAEIEEPTDDIDSDLLDRIQGSIVGMALGDALGAHVEFRPHEYVQEHPVTDLGEGGTWGLKRGQFTDDTSMGLCLANSLIARRDFVPYDQLVRYKWWSRSGYMSSTGKCFDIGAATSQSIYEFVERQKRFAKEKGIPFEQMDYLSDPELLDQFDIYCSDDDAAGNGALMRLSPVPLFFYRNKYVAIEFSGRSGQITHGDRKAYDACRFYGALIVAALRGWTKEQILAPNFYSDRRHWFGEEPLHKDIVSIAEGSYKKKYGYEGGIRGKGYIVNALEAALWAFWSDDGSFEKGALAAVNLGDDTDTTAAIYGQLAGAHYGYKKLPQKWLKEVYALDFMKKLSKWIAYEGKKWADGRENSFSRQSRGSN